MPQFCEPDLLINLALESFAKYVCGLCRHFVALSQISDTDEILCDSWQVCQDLRDLLCNMIPASLANEVTFELLKHIESQHDASTLFHLKPQCKAIIQELICAIIHPEVTVLDLSPDPLHEFGILSWDFTVPFIYTKLNSLKKLKVLRVTDNSEHHDLILQWNVLDNLEHFAFLGMSDYTLLKHFAYSFRRLKKLEIQGCTHLYNSYINILKFSYLEELNVLVGGISEEGKTYVLTKLANTRDPAQLKSFGFSSLTSDQFTFLVHNFRNLTRLELSTTRNCDMDLLKGLSQLRVFSVMQSTFLDISKVVQAVGNQLLCLHFGCFDCIDPRIIDANCSALKCLHMSSLTSGLHYPVIHKQYALLPAFRNVTCLDVSLLNSPGLTGTIFSQCTNVRTVRIKLKEGNDNIVAKSVLKRNPLQHLKELNWWSHYTVPLSRETTMQIVEHCSSLITLRGRYVWSKYGNVEKLLVETRRMTFLTDSL